QGHVVDPVLLLDPHQHVLPPPGRHLAGALGAPSPVGALLVEVAVGRVAVHAPAATRRWWGHAGSSPAPPGAPGAGRSAAGPVGTACGGTGGSAQGGGRRLGHAGRVLAVAGAVLPGDVGDAGALPLRE